MQDISVIILAAGFGTRMKSKTPKVLFKICDEYMIVHILKRAYEICNDVSVVLNYDFDNVKNVVLSHFPKTKIYKQDMKKFPGTAGALMNIDYKKKNTIILCGDMPLITKNELEKISQNDADIAVCAFRTENPYGYGRVITDANKIIKIVEEKDANLEEKSIKLVNSGCYCIKNKFLKEILSQISNNNTQKEYYLTDAISIANNMGLKVEFIEVNSRNFMGINDKYTLSIAQDIMQEDIKKFWMQNGVLFRLPKTTFVGVNVQFSGECIVEENSTILGNTTIKESHIKSCTVIEDSIIENSTIGPIARIRPKSIIKNSKIGNFVEIKNSNLNGVKAGHLSYIGDSDVDDGVNIGCGTITCNYDGIKKHKTIIQSNVFIGSGSQLIAPITIEKNSIIAAGTTVTKDVKEGCLAISRVRQENKDGYFYKIFKDKKC